MTVKLPVKLLLFALSLVVLGRVASSQGLAPQPSPVERKIEAAKRGIAENPQKYQFYNDLVLALVRRVRETSDTDYYDQAQEALKQSLRLAPDNIEGQKLQVLLLLGRHEYAKAREEAAALNKRMPDDILVWGYLADADIALGNYGDAEKSAQWMIDLRPGNIPGLIRGARLRALYGDFDGAMDFLNDAYLQTPPNEVEDQAYYLAQMADLDLARGKLDQAANLLAQALQLFPGYDVAVAGMARVRIAQHKFAEAVDLLRRRNPTIMDPHRLYELAGALERAGQRREAEVTYREFEQKALAQVEQADNANRDLIFYYTDYARKPSEALRTARLEVARRHDVETLDAWAWSLYANGNSVEARAELEKALALGVRDAVFFYHAGVIESALKRHSDAAQFFKQSLDLNPFSEVAVAARAALEQQAPASAALARR